MSKRLVRLPETEAKTGHKRSQIYKLMALGKFPKPVKCGRITAWVDEELDRYIEQRIAERDGVTEAA